MDFFGGMKDGIVRAGREAARVRFIGEVQARLLALRLTRRTQRDAVVTEALRLYRRNAVTQAPLVPLLRDLSAMEDEIERLEAALARARGNATTPSDPRTPTVTELDRPRPNNS